MEGTGTGMKGFHEFPPLTTVLPLGIPGEPQVFRLILPAGGSMVTKSAALQSNLTNPVFTTYYVTWANYLISMSLCFLTGKMG